MISLLFSVTILVTIMTAFKVMSIAYDKRYRNDVTTVTFLAVLTALLWGFYNYLTI